MRTLLSVAQLSERFPGLSQPALRWLLFNRRANGLEKSAAVVRNGRRVLIDPDKFLTWLEGEQHASLPTSREAPPRAP